MTKLTGLWATPDDVRAIVREELSAATTKILNHLLQTERRLMANLQKEFDDLRAAMDAETTRIADYIQQLLALQQRDDLTADQEQAVLDGFGAVTARLRGLGTSPTEPVPPTPLPPLPTP